jgi:hypothetical protein
MVELQSDGRVRCEIALLLKVSPVPPDPPQAPVLRSLRLTKRLCRSNPYREDVRFRNLFARPGEESGRATGCGAATLDAPAVVNGFALTGW